MNQQQKQCQHKKCKHYDYRYINVFLDDVRKCKNCGLIQIKEDGKWREFHRHEFQPLWNNYQMIKGWRIFNSARP